MGVTVVISEKIVMRIKSKLTTPDQFSKTFSYEAFMKRAFDVQDTQRLHIHRANMENLLAAEIRRVEQLEKVKGYITSALEKISQRSQNSTDNARFDRLRERVENASYSSELVHVINEALAITQS